MAQALEQTDGRWAWVVLLSSLVTQALTVGFPACIGVFFTDLQHDFHASNSETSWFPSILSAMVHGGGPLCSILVKYLGCRVTMMLGGVMASLGMVASTFSGSLTHLFLTAGVITGLGMCFSFQSSITVVGLYFVRRRPLANALSSMGLSMGVTLWPLLARYLLETLGWRGAFLIFSGIFLHCCVCGALLRPVATNEVPEPKEDPLLPPKIPTRSCLATCASTIRYHLAFDILRHNMSFCIYITGLTWMNLGFALPHIFLVPYAMHHGVDDYWAAMLMSIVGFCNIFLRPVAGLLLAGRKSLAAYRKYLFAVAILINGLTNLICTVSADFRVLLGYCLVYSLSMCGIGILVFQVLMDIVPMDRFPSALGFFTILCGMTSLISPPLAGLLLDKTNNFSYIFYMSSGFLISGSLILGVGFYASEKKLKQDGQAKMEDATSEMTSVHDLTSEDKNSAKKQPYPESIYMTSV